MEQTNFVSKPSNQVGKSNICYLSSLKSSVMEETKFEKKTHVFA